MGFCSSDIYCIGTQCPCSAHSGQTFPQPQKGASGRGLHGGGGSCTHPSASRPLTGRPLSALYLWGGAMGLAATLATCWYLAMSGHEGYDPFSEWQTMHPNYTLPAKPYGSTNIKPKFVQKIFQRLRPAFVVEVGSFTGGSAVMMGQRLQALGLNAAFILCIDTWLGDLRMWADGVERRHVDLQSGRPQVWMCICYCPAPCAPITLPSATITL